MVDAFDAAVGAGVVGVRDDTVDAEALVENAREFRKGLKTVEGKGSNGASPEGGVAIDEDVGHAGCGEFSLSGGEYVGAAAETVGEQEDMGFALRRDGYAPEIVDADEDTAAVW